ncbi:MAG: transcriptional regulator [Candidatus Geothermarchaeales archaeon]
MSKDQALGTILLIGSALGVLAYGWLVFLSEWSLLILQLTAFIALATMLCIVAWIGYTLATTPPPEPIEALSESGESEKEE